VPPHPEREAPEVRRLRPDFETEATAMRAVMEHERARGRQVHAVSEKNLGHDATSLGCASGELRLVEVTGLLAVNSMTKPMQVREDCPPHGGNRPSFDGRAEGRHADALRLPERLRRRGALRRPADHK
jgi:hypothetical protein